MNAPAADIESRLLGRYTIGEGLPQGIAHRAAQQQLLGYLEIPAA